jgi:hypothetical protein
VYDMTAEVLYMETQKVLNNKEYEKKAKELQLKIKGYHGSKQAMESIEKYWA